MAGIQTRIFGIMVRNEF